MKTDVVKGLAVFAGLVGLGVGSRFLHQETAPNMTAIAACALFAGFMLRSRLAAAAVPLVAMAITDLWFGAHRPLVMAVVYGGLTLPVLLAPLVGSGRNPLRVAGAGLLGSIAFFLLTNLAHWASTDMYARTLSGLLECYAYALPFFRFTVQGDLAYALILFTAYTLVTLARTRRAELPAAAPAAA